MGIRDFFKKTTDFVKTSQELNRSDIDSLCFAEYVLAHYGGGAGGNIPESKKFKNECERLKTNCRKERGDQFSERIYLLEVAGDGITSKTPKALRLKANAYSWAGASCRRKAINAFTEYLNGEQWDEGLPDDMVIRLDGRPIRRQAALLANAWMELGKAYQGEKEFENAEHAYRTAIQIDGGSHLYLVLAGFYQRTKQFDKAIKLLQSVKSTINDTATQTAITNKISVCENQKLGVREHRFSGYDSIETFYDSETKENKNYEYGLYKKLKSKYKDIFEEHRRLLERMDYNSVRMKEVGLGDDEINQDYIKVCIADINLFDALNSFYAELNKLGLTNKYEIGDGYKNGYDVFKKLCVFYEKLSMYEDAIYICQLAIQKGIIEDGTKGKMHGRMERLKKKSAKNSK